MKASKVLLETKAKKAFNVLMCEDGKMCASGVLLRRMGFQKFDLVDSGYYPDSFLEIVNTEPVYNEVFGGRSQVRQDMFYSMVGDFYNGITEETWRAIIARNDYGWSFQKIGKWLERQGL